MSRITFLGQASFKIETPLATLVLDPFDPNFLKGYKWYSPQADILLISHDHADHNYRAGVKGDPFVIDKPGEYEVRGISVFGVACFHDNEQGSQRGTNVAYSVNLPEDVRVVHLGDLGHVLSDQQVSDLGVVDVLFVPVGGKFTIDAVGAKKVVEQLQPSLIVPMHYGVPGKITAQWGLKGAEEFLQAMGISQAAKEIKELKIKSPADLPEESEVVVMQISDA